MHDRYDRTILRAIAREKGIENGAALAEHIGVSPVTGWRLWNGVTFPARPVQRLVEQHLGLTPADLERKAA